MGVHYDDTYAPVANSKSIKLLLAIAVTLGLHLRSVDFKTAFLHAKRGKDSKKVYFQPPKGAGCPPGKVWLVLERPDYLTYLTLNKDFSRPIIMMDL